jgi:hypothetical protein
MSDKVLLVVGDKFVHFAAGKDIITLSQLRALLSIPGVFRIDMQHVVLAPGQGLGDDDIAEMLGLVERSARADRFDMSLWRNVPRRAPAKLSHKHKPENTLISVPRRVSDDRFELDILIHEQCEMMADHQTGQHLQGMVLLEAARQSLLAVTEAHFLAADGPRFSFIFNELSIRYARFAFPFGATLHYVIREKEIAEGRRLRFVVDIDIQQCGVSAAAFTAEFTAFEQTRIARQEERQARDALGVHLEAAVADIRQLPLAA